MSNGKHTEARFEDAIELELLARGYSKRDRATYDTKRGIFPEDVIACTTGVPGLKTASVYFVVAHDKVTVVGVSYLGRDVWPRVSHQETFEDVVSRADARSKARKG